MDAYRKAIYQRQTLDLTDIFPPLPSKTSSSLSSSSTSSSSSSSSVSSSSASTSSTSSTSSTTSTSSTIIPPPATTPPPPPTTSPTTSTHTITQTAVQQTSASSTPSLAPHNTSFLQNKVASGIVFTLVGIIGFVLVMMAITYAWRRKRKQRRVEDAVSFDPVNFENHRDGDALEKKLESRRTSGSTYVTSAPELKSSTPFAEYAPPSPSHVYVPSAPPYNIYPQQGYYNDYGGSRHSPTNQWGPPPPAAVQHNNLHVHGDHNGMEGGYNRSSGGSGEMQFSSAAIPPYVGH